MVRPASLHASLIVAALVAVSTAAAATAVTVARVFEIHHRSVAEAALVVQPLLSDEGALTLEPRHARLTVQDRPEVVDRIARTLEAFDRPPARFRIRAELYEASSEPGAGNDTAVADLKLSQVFRYTSFRRLGQAILEGDVGATARAELGEGYLVRFTVSPADGWEGFVVPEGSSPLVRPPAAGRWPAEQTGETSTDAADGRVRLERLVLARVGAPGGLRAQEVLRSSALLAAGQRVVLGASASESARKALVLVLQAEPVKGR
jgi:hypothetical protein